MWTGKLHDAKQHFKECVYAGALCGFGCGAVVRRIDMSEHEASICPKRGVQCTNVGCTAVMPEPMIAAHKANNCPYEVVDCPFSGVGCDKRVLRKDVNTHIDAATNQHILLLLQDNRSLRQKVAEQDVRLNTQLHQIVYKVKLADLIRGGEVDMCSDVKMVGAYKVSMYVKKGYADNGNCCGVYLYLEDGPFPCRVSSTIEIVNWDGKPESTYKREINNEYEEEIGWGPFKFIPLRKLTAAASPYVKDGEVTFIVTFRILPLE